jgi:hypothetical protein
MNATDTSDLNKVRAAALERVTRGERNVKWALLVAAIVEATGLITYLLLMDFHNRLHILLLVMGILIYGTLAAGIFALGAYVNLATQRILKAILLQGESPT